jgi:hypothetical protein
LRPLLTADVGVLRAAGVLAAASSETELEGEEADPDYIIDTSSGGGMGHDSTHAGQGKPSKRRRAVRDVFHSVMASAGTVRSNGGGASRKSGSAAHSVNTGRAHLLTSPTGAHTSIERILK